MLPYFAYVLCFYIEICASGSKSLVVVINTLSVEVFILLRQD
jgi:hypothetical protein